MTDKTDDRAGGAQPDRAAGPASEAEYAVTLDAAHCDEARASLERLARILRDAPNLEPAARQELADAAEELRHALEPVYERSPAQARSVTHFAEAAAHEAAKPEPDRGLIDIALQGLNRAAQPIEEAQPQIVQIAGRIAQALANIGI